MSGFDEEDFSGWIIFVHGKMIYAPARLKAGLNRQLTTGNFN